MRTPARTNPLLDATRVPTALDEAWAAGVYEGEGSVFWARSPVVEVPQRDPEVLHRLRELFGGSVRFVGTRNYYQWRACGDRARKFLRAVYPWLSEWRRAQVDAKVDL